MFCCDSTLKLEYMLRCAKICDCENLTYAPNSLHESCKSTNMAEYLSEFKALYAEDAGEFQCKLINFFKMESLFSLTKELNQLFSSACRTFFDYYFPDSYHES